MEFEYDPEKSIANQAKHGVNFIDAQALWEDANRVEVPARTDDEARWLVVGRIGETHYSAIITYRGDRITLISVRRARKEETAIYES